MLLPPGSIRGAPDTKLLGLVLLFIEDRPLCSSNGKSYFCTKKSFAPMVVVTGRRSPFGVYGKGFTGEAWMASRLHLLSFSPPVPLPRPPASPPSRLGPLLQRAVPVPPLLPCLLCSRAGPCLAPSSCPGGAQPCAVPPSSTAPGLCRRVKGIKQQFLWDTAFLCWAPRTDSSQSRSGVQRTPTVFPRVPRLPSSPTAVLQAENVSVLLFGRG